MTRFLKATVATVATAAVAVIAATSVLGYLDEREHRDTMECLERAALIYKKSAPDDDSVWGKDLSYAEVSARAAGRAAVRCE